MKKAISNWGAAGKDSTKEFSKTLKEIDEQYIFNKDTYLEIDMDPIRI